MLTEATLQNCKIFPNSIINQCAEFLSLITFQTTGCVTQLCLPGLYFYLTNAWRNTPPATHSRFPIFSSNTKWWCRVSSFWHNVKTDRSGTFLCSNDSVLYSTDLLCNNFYILHSKCLYIGTNCDNHNNSLFIKHRVILCMSQSWIRSYMNTMSWHIPYIYKLHRGQSMTTSIWTVWYVLLYLSATLSSDTCISRIDSTSCCWS